MSQSPALRHIIGQAANDMPKGLLQNAKTPAASQGRGLCPPGSIKLHSRKKCSAYSYKLRIRRTFCMCILLRRRAGQSRVFACPGACRERDVEDAVPYGGNQDLRAIPDISRGSPFFGRGKPLPYEGCRHPDACPKTGGWQPPLRDGWHSAVPQGRISSARSCLPP